MPSDGGSKPIGARMIPQNMPDVWGEGALFALSGLDGQTNERIGLVATLGRYPGEFLFI